MKCTLFCAVVATCVPASAATLVCSIHVPPGSDAAQWEAQANVTLAAARAKALAVIDVHAAQVVEGELRVELGCLVYSFDIRIPDKSGIEEVMIDPGNGAVLARRHESLNDMASERANEIKARLQRGPHEAR